MAGDSGVRAVLESVAGPRIAWDLWITFTEGKTVRMIVLAEEPGKAVDIATLVLEAGASGELIEKYTVEQLSLPVWEEKP